MELYSLEVFLTVVTERSFSRAAQKLYRTQPAISLALQRLEQEVGEKLIDRGPKDFTLTDAGRTVVDYARRFMNLEQELQNSLTELRDKSSGRLTIGANESATLYLLRHIERYRELYPGVKVTIRRSQSSLIPNEILDGNLEMGVISYDPGDERIETRKIFSDSLVFVVSPKHRLAHRRTVAISELGGETFVAHNVVSPYRERVIRLFREQKVPLRIDVEMPTIETIRKLVQNDLGVAFLPRMCVEQEIEHKLLREVHVKEMQWNRNIFLVYPARRVVSHAARAFLELVG
ncbi:MAG: LysR family transcriptional regulator [Acidobacteriia bacterium]|nr:LysR family transcriptional regulator [Terriglobia bacterium]MBV8903376.1 LysR family transcriptional regulator [Terriglobia bacterium]MBV9742349.1 LysR family transcriptional regulator [Terriglobia bacterium]